MADNIKPLVIKVQEKSIPNGVAHAWNDISQAMPTFTKDIKTPDIDVKGEGGVGNIGAMISGMPTVFARANMFKLALNYVTDKNETTSGLMEFYRSLIEEWRGLISCLALDYANVRTRRIYLRYSDKKSIADTANIYEPKGAFGNVLFERKPIWCDQGLAENEEKVPFIDVITYKGQVVGGTSPESFLFTSVAYKLTDSAPFIGLKSKKFTDPLYSELTQEQFLQLYGYVNYVLGNIPKFVDFYKNLPPTIQCDYSNLVSNLTTWKVEIERKASEKGISLDGASAPPVNVFGRPYSTLFNYSSELYGLEGVIYEKNIDGQAILFDPRKLLLDKSSEIARIDYGNEAMKDSNFLSKSPIFVLRADILGMPGCNYYFALPLSPLGLNVFGKNIAALVGMDEATAIQSRMTAVFDPSQNRNNLKVKLHLVTDAGRVKDLEEVYTTGSAAIKSNDVLIWPNFISRQWNRYFMYSEIPHNVSTQVCPFKATPFVGDVNDTYFRILVDSETSQPVFLSKNGKIDVPVKYQEKLKAQLHVVSDNRVADNQYKYEIYECNQPFKGVRLNNADRESGYIIIRYSSLEIDGLPINYLEVTKDLAEANLGIDFGSTNTSVAYFSKRVQDVIEVLNIENKRVSLFGNDNSKDSNLHPALEDELFFFQNESIKSNSIKSILTIHDSKRVSYEGVSNQSAALGQSVKGGFPCFEKNIPIIGVTENRYKVQYSRSGVAEIVYNMKWSNQDIENEYKKAYLSSLLLHIYAQLFIEGHIPTQLKWSYPSSMGKNLLGKYNEIWASLSKENPIVDGAKLNVLTALAGVNLESNQSNPGNYWAQSAGGGWGTTQAQSAGGGWGTTQAQSAGGGWGTTQAQPVAQQQSGWGNNSAQNASAQMVDIKTETGPIDFNFSILGSNMCLTEACAVANFFSHQNSIDTSSGSLTLCFDVGGSTTDISALTQMMGKNGPAMAMVKQNSIRFAAQRVSGATKYSKNIKDALIEMCDRKHIRIQGLNTPNSKFSSDLAPYYYDQVLDRLEGEDFQTFYRILHGKCPELMIVNIYVTGLILFYAGQLSCKLIQEIERSNNKIIAPINRVNVTFAGKGARIFDWFSAVDCESAKQYYLQMFVTGFGGMEKALQFLVKEPEIKLPNGNGTDKVKYEVAKGLAYPTEALLVPQCDEAIEILGEDGFFIINSQGQRIPLRYDNSLTSEMMENIGSRFVSAPAPGNPPCPQFMNFAFIFNQVATTVFGFKMSEEDYVRGFQGMNINNYIKTLPEFYAAQESKKEKKSVTKQFDFIAPIIILEGMKFYDEYLMSSMQKV